MNRLAVVPLSVALLLATACSREVSQDAAQSAASAEVMEDTAQAAAADAMAPPMSKAGPQAALAAPASSRAAVDAGSAPPEASQVASGAMTQVDPRRRFIRTANAEFRVEDVYASTNAIEALAARHGGFVTRNDVAAQVTSTQSRSLGNGRQVELATYITRGTMQVRVPSDRGSPFLREMLSQMQFLDSRRFEALDAQFELLRQQLAQARAQQAQAAIGVAVESGGRLVDKVDAIATQADAKAARDDALITRRTYEDKVEFATLDLALYQTPRIRRTEMLDIDAALRAEGPGFWTRIRQALQGGWQGLQSVFIALIAMWPLWISAGIALLLLRAWRLRIRRTR